MPPASTSKGREWCIPRIHGPSRPCHPLCSLLGWCWGERLRDGERGWFPQACARPITSRVAAEGNVRRMERLRIETDV